MVLTALGGIPSIRIGDDLAEMIAEALTRTEVAAADGDVLVVAQKIVSKAEGRQVRLADVTPSDRALELADIANKDSRVVELILRESIEVLRCRTGVIIVEHRSGLVMANAGIDASNVEAADGDESVLLLPLDADRSAGQLRAQLRHRLGCELGIVINDSFGRAWRNGTIGTAIGAAGITALWDMRGLPDRNGRVLRATEVALADEVAAAGSLLMGQAAEGFPVIHVRGFPVSGGHGIGRDLIRDRSLDLFR
jgi:coenzyme F420-0:L-glutamate ligase/coenzyme F420-1:gamma-L-glutamate ligase